MSDGTRVRQALAGDVSAFEDLVRRWAPRVTALCHARTGRADAAEDLAQESLMRSFRALGSLRDPEKFGPWLCGIAVRACLDWFKKKKRAHVTFGVLGTEEPAIEQKKGGKEEELDSLMSEVEALPEQYREVVMLYYYNDLTYRDLAAILGVSAATINARLTKARARLRERMSGARRIP